MQTTILYKWCTIHVRISDDDYHESPREWSDSKLCIQSHLRYNFPNELGFDFDSYHEEQEKTETNDLATLWEKYYIFFIDCYEHSSIHLSLSWEWMQCRFDTSKNCGFIAMDKQEYTTEEEAKEQARKEIKLYNQYINGEIYEYEVEEAEEFCGGFYDADEAMKQAKEYVESVYTTTHYI